MQCSKCQQENPPGARFCIGCGSPLAVACAGCRTELPPAARFCPQCGRPAAPSGERPTSDAHTTQASVPRHLAQRILESRAAIEGERKQVTVLLLYDRDRNGSLAALYSGHDAGVCCRISLALTQWTLGYPDRAMSALKEAQRLGVEIANPLSDLINSLFGAWVHFQRGERQAARAHASSVIAICERYAIAGWAMTAQVIDCAADELAPSPERLAEVEHATQSATAWRRTFGLVVIAELCADSDRLDRAREMLERIVPRERSAMCASEIERIEGRLCLAKAEPVTEEAERHFRRAIQIAHEREEKSYELRSATGLARLLDSPIPAQASMPRARFHGLPTGSLPGIDPAFRRLRASRRGFSKGPANRRRPAPRLEYRDHDE